MGNRTVRDCQGAAIYCEDGAHEYAAMAAGIGACVDCEGYRAHPPIVLPACVVVEVPHSDDDGGCDGRHPCPCSDTP